MRTKIKPDDKFTTAGGRVFTLQELLDETGCTRERAIARIGEHQRGQISEDTLFAEYKPSNFNGLHIDGRYVSVREIAREANITYREAVDRIKAYQRGEKTLEEVLKQGEPTYETGKSTWEGLEDLQPRRSIEEIKIGSWEKQMLMSEGLI